MHVCSYGRGPNPQPFRQKIGQPAACRRPNSEPALAHASANSVGPREIFWLQDPKAVGGGRPSAVLMLASSPTRGSHCAGLIRPRDARLHHSSAWHDVACMHRFELSHDLTDRPRVGAPSSCQLVFARGPRPFAWCRGSKVRALGQKPSPVGRVLLEATLGSEPGTSPMCPEIIKKRPNL